MKDNRTGRFSVDMRTIDEFPEEVQLLMGGCIVVRAEVMWAEGKIDYTAFSTHFDAVQEGEIIPEYEWKVAKGAFSDKKTPSFRRKK